MAERRMFAKTIIDSDAFLDLPLSTQALYFHLSMRADDDGFVNNPKKIQRMIGASDDDCKLLILKQFIITFENGIIVIKHWKIHNYIRRDTYKETPYADEKDRLTVEKTGAYSLQPRNAVVDESVTPPLPPCNKCVDEAVTPPLPHCNECVDEAVTPSLPPCNECVDEAVTPSLPPCNEPLTQDRLGKDRLGKDRLGKGNTTPQAEAEQLSPCPYSKIRDAYHNICVSFPKIRAIEGVRRKAVAARWRTYKSLDVFEEMFEIAEASSFLKGDNNRNWSADFDWMMNAANFSKILEHKYDNCGAANDNPTGIFGTLARMYEEADG